MYFVHTASLNYSLINPLAFPHKKQMLPVMFAQGTTVKVLECPHKDVFTDTPVAPTVFKVLSWHSNMLCESVFPPFKTLWESLF